MTSSQAQAKAVRTSERYCGCVSGLASVTVLVSGDAVIKASPALLLLWQPPAPAHTSSPLLPSSLIVQVDSTGPDISMETLGEGDPETHNQCPLTIEGNRDKIWGLLAGNKLGAPVSAQRRGGNHEQQPGWEYRVSWSTGNCRFAFMVGDSRLTFSPFLVAWVLGTAFTCNG